MERSFDLVFAVNHSFDLASASGGCFSLTTLTCRFEELLTSVVGQNTCLLDLFLESFERSFDALLLAYSNVQS